MHYTHVRDEAGVVETCTVVLAACGSACQLIERQLPRRSISWHARSQATITTVVDSCRWARSLAWSPTPRLVSSRSSTTAWCGQTAASDRGQAASQQLWPWAPRSLQLLGHIDSSHWWHWGLSRCEPCARPLLTPPDPRARSLLTPPPTLRRRLSGDACPWL